MLHEAQARALPADVVTSRPPRRHSRLATAATLFTLAPVALGAAAACSASGSTLSDGPRTTISATTNPESSGRPAPSSSKPIVHETLTPASIGTPEELITSTGTTKFSLLTPSELNSHLLEVAQTGRNIGLIMDLQYNREGIYTNIDERAELGNTTGSVALLRLKDGKEYPVFCSLSLVVDIDHNIATSGSKVLVVGSYTPIPYDILQSVLKRDRPILQAPNLPYQIPFAYVNVNDNGVQRLEKVAYILDIKAATANLNAIHESN